MNRLLLTALTMMLMILVSGCGNEYKHLTADAALKMMQSDPNVIILDVRTREEYDKRHIPNALLVPIAEIRAGNAEKYLPDKNRTIMTYCWTGRRAEDA